MLDVSRWLAERGLGHCLTSAPTEQIEGFAERRISGSSQ
jgi:transposase InsO family protein